MMPSTMLSFCLFQVLSFTYWDTGIFFVMVCNISSSYCHQLLTSVCEINKLQASISHLHENVKQHLSESPWSISRNIGAMEILRENWLRFWQSHPWSISFSIKNYFIVFQYMYGAKLFRNYKQKFLQPWLHLWCMDLQPQNGFNVTLW